MVRLKPLYVLLAVAAVAIVALSRMIYMIKAERSTEFVGEFVGAIVAVVLVVIIFVLTHWEDLKRPSKEDTHGLKQP